MATEKNNLLQDAVNMLYLLFHVKCVHTMVKISLARSAHSGLEELVKEWKQVTETPSSGRADSNKVCVLCVRACPYELCSLL